MYNLASVKRTNFIPFSSVLQTYQYTSCNTVPCFTPLINIDRSLSCNVEFYKKSFFNCFKGTLGPKLRYNVKNNKSLSSSSTSIVTNSQTEMLRLGHYDCIGFDLDNTLCEYNLTSSVKLSYDLLANYLVTEKGYDSEFLYKPLNEKAIDFLQKGLIIDFDRGNVLKVTDNGVICNCSHGTKFMTVSEIESTYGKDRKWAVTSEFCKNLLVAWNGPLEERMRALLDYFDMSASLAFARIIDSLDSKLGKPSSYNVWPDVLDGLSNMYKREHYVEGKGGYFEEIKSNPHKYIKQCTPEVLDWLKKVKQEKLTFLITGSNCDFASLTAETCLGKDWRHLFDIVICYARKPGFFTERRPFIDVYEFKETDLILEKHLRIGKLYSQGNWQELYQLFSKQIGTKAPQCLYFGDNLIQDVYTPSKYTKCDVVAVVEELGAESCLSNSKSHHHSALLSSHNWGSYFFDERSQSKTVWSGIINNYSKLCIPSLSALAQYSLDYEFQTFGVDPKNEHGYFPVTPGSNSDDKRISKE